MPIIQLLAPEAKIYTPSGRISLPSIRRIDSHASIVPILGVIECEEAMFVLTQYSQHSLHDALLYCPSLFDDVPIKRLFVLYQVGA